MRTMMYTSVTLEDGSKISLGNIGIGTSDKDKYAGHLYIDENKLKEALEKNPEAVEQLFTKTAKQNEDVYDYSTTPPTVKKAVLKSATQMFNEKGIADRFSDLISRAIDFGGSIREQAGIEGTSSAGNNILLRQLSDYDKRMNDMLKFLQKREEYYYNMFAKMEQAMMKADSQMQSLSASLGGMMG
jgi:flagellar hook-associated protein 2